MKTADPLLEPPLWLSNDESARLRGPPPPPRHQPSQAGAKQQDRSWFRNTGDRREGEIGGVIQSTTPGGHESRNERPGRPVVFHHAIVALAADEEVAVRPKDQALRAIQSATPGGHESRQERPGRPVVFHHAVVDVVEDEEIAVRPKDRAFRAIQSATPGWH